MSKLSASLKFREFLEGNPVCRKFYRKLTNKLTMRNLAYNAIGSNMLETRLGDLVKSFELALEIGSDFVPIPGVSAIATTINELVSRLAEKLQENAIARILDSLDALLDFDDATEVGPTAGENMLRDAAALITFTYQDQINTLDEIDCYRLVDSAVFRVIMCLNEELFTIKDNNYCGAERLLHAVDRHMPRAVSGYYSILGKEKLGLPWTDEGIFQRTGIKISNESGGHDFYHGTNSLSWLYDYRTGQTEDIERLGFNAATDINQTTGEQQPPNPSPTRIKALGERFNNLPQPNLGVTNIDRRRCSMM